MSGEIFRQFSPIELFRLILHGLFIVAPLIFFPIFREELNLDVYILIAVTFVGGLFLFSIPCDRLFPNFRKYKEEFNKFLENSVDNIDISPIKENTDIRSVYDILFYKIYPENIRVRIHFLVSLYYFYSRTFIVGLLYALLGMIGIVGYYTIFKNFVFSSISFITLLNDFLGISTDPYFIIRLIIFTLFSGVITLFSYRRSEKLLQDVTNFERAVFMSYIPVFRNIVWKIIKEMNSDPTGVFSFTEL